MSVPVSADTERRLREAMKRLFNGEAVSTDGAFTLANLGREAGLSPATVHRAVRIKAEFAAEVGRRRAEEALAQLARRQEQAGNMKRKLAERNQELRAMREAADLLAQQVQYLHLRNQCLVREITRLQKGPL